MKNTLTLLLLIIIFLLPVHASVAAEQKIATINVGKAFKGYWRTAVEDKRLKKEVEEVKARVSREEKKLQELVTELENMKKVLSNPNMNQVERARRTKQFTDKQRALTGISKQLNLWKKSVDKDLVEKDRKATEKIRGEILEVISAQAKKGGYTVVVDSKALLYSSADLDITTQVLAQLNVNDPGKVEAPKKK